MGLSVLAAYSTRSTRLKTGHSQSTPGFEPVNAVDTRAKEEGGDVALWHLTPQEAGTANRIEASQGIRPHMLDMQVIEALYPKNEEPHDYLHIMQKRKYGKRREAAQVGVRHLVPGERLRLRGRAHQSRFQGRVAPR